MRTALWLSVLALAVVGCAAPAPAPRPLVIVSVLPQRFFVERIAGERVDVEVLLPPGASPALYEPTLAQLEAISRASLWVAVGHPHFPFEATWLARIAERNPDLRLLKVGASDAAHGDDPHVWTSPRYGRVLARAIGASLAELLPEHRAELTSRAYALLDEIDALDRDLRAELAPARGSRFFVFHAAWGRLAEEYGLEQVSIEHGSREPGVYELAELIARARAERARVIFVQPQFDPQAALVLADEIGARVEVLDPLAYDWSANLRQVARQLAAAAS